MKRVERISYYEELLDRITAANGELEQALANTQHVNELLGMFGCAHGPETAANAACHDNEVIVDSCHNAKVMS